MYEALRTSVGLGAIAGCCIDLTGAVIEDKGASALAASLGGCAGLEEIVVADNFITEAGGASLAQLANTAVRLDASNNELGCAGAGSFARHLDAPQLLHLSLRDNEISVDGAFSLARCLQKGAMPQLCSLNLRQNLLLDEGAAALCEALTGLETLQV